MRFILLVVFLVFGLIVFSSQGIGQSLNTSPEVNQIVGMKINDSSEKPVMGMNLGTSDDISSVTLTFRTVVGAGGTADISLKNSNNVEIGSGSKVVSPSSATAVITLSDTITAEERDTIRSVNISCTDCSPPIEYETITVVDGFDEKNDDTLENLGKTYQVQTSDNNQVDLEDGYYMSFEFSNPTIPGGSTLMSVIIYAEYYTESGFSSGGISWVTDGSSTTPPDNEGESNEAVHSWDVTSIITTFAEVDSLELKMENSGGTKIKPDYVYAEIGWLE